VKSLKRGEPRTAGAFHLQSVASSHEKLCAAEGNKNHELVGVRERLTGCGV